jgi:hypothetical protein
MVFIVGTDRAITDYRSSCTLDNLIMQQNGIKSQQEYRQFIQRNALKLAQIDRDLVQKRTGA